MDSQSGFLYEQWRALNPGSANPYQGGCLRRFQPATTTDTPPSDIQCTTAIADGQPLWPMMLTPEEVLDDKIDHALRFILPNNKIGQHVFVYPATHSTGPTSLPPPALPYGAWLRLKWTDEQIDQWVQANKPGNVYLGRILRALRKHGMILSDGGNVALTWANDANRKVKWAEVGIDSHSLIGSPPIMPNDFDWIVPPEVDPADFHAVPLTYDCKRVPLNE
jgi:serine/threonine-protein kinase